MNFLINQQIKITFFNKQLCIKKRNNENKKMRIKKDKIAFERLFNKSMRRKAKDFLESGRPVATLTKGVLLFAALGGILAVGIMAPNLFKIFRVDSRERGKRLSDGGFKRARRSCYQLRKSGLIELFPDKKGNVLLRITEKGEKMIAKLLGISQPAERNKKWVTIEAPSQWDEKWRFILFDIPIDFNSERNILRRELRAFGCYQLQQSVFVHPFSCVREVLDIVRRLNVARYVEVCTVEDFANKDALLFFEPLLRQYKEV